MHPSEPRRKSSKNGSGCLACSYAPQSTCNKRTGGAKIMARTCGRDPETRHKTSSEQQATSSRNRLPCCSAVSWVPLEGAQQQTARAGRHTRAAGWKAEYDGEGKGKAGQGRAVEAAAAVEVPWLSGTERATEQKSATAARQRGVSTQQSMREEWKLEKKKKRIAWDLPEFDRSSSSALSCNML